VGGEKAGGARGRGDREFLRVHSSLPQGRLQGGRPVCGCSWAMDLPSACSYHLSFVRELSNSGGRSSVDRHLARDKGPALVRCRKTPLPSGIGNRFPT
jgi:hypothetical protein